METFPIGLWRSQALCSVRFFVLAFCFILRARSFLRFYNTEKRLFQYYKNVLSFAASLIADCVPGPGAL